MWGALLDTTLMQSSPTSVISFHGIYNPIVPYGDGIPFEPFVKEMLSEMPGGSWAGGYLAKKVMPVVYGSSCVDAEARSIGNRSALYAYNIHKHTLVRDDDTGKLNSQHEEFFERMNAFFVDEMIGQPVSLHHDFSDAQLFRLDHPANVSECSWSITGGLITEAPDSSSVRVLLFGSDHTPSLTLRGIYTSGIAFEHSFPIGQ